MSKLFETNSALPIIPTVTQSDTIGTQVQLLYPIRYKTIPLIV